MNMWLLNQVVQIVTKRLRAYPYGFRSIGTAIVVEISCPIKRVALTVSLHSAVHVRVSNSLTTSLLNLCNVPDLLIQSIDVDNEE
jgi:hypothetical protein